LLHSHSFLCFLYLRQISILINLPGMDAYWGYIAVYGSVLFLLLAFYFTGRKEGWRERERQVLQESGSNDEYRKCQRKWHTAGFWQRLFIALAVVVQFLPDWISCLFWLSVALWFGWVGYDGWSNMYKKLTGIIVPGEPTFFQRFFYSGTTGTGTGSVIDQKFGTWLPTIKIIYTVLVIVFIALYLILVVFK